MSTMLSLSSALVLSALLSCAFSAGIKELGTSILGANPATVNHLNGEAFQQDPLVTFNGESCYLLPTEYTLIAMLIIRIPVRCVLRR